MESYGFFKYSLINCINFIREFKLQTHLFFSSLLDISVLELISTEITLDERAITKTRAHCPRGADVSPENLFSYQKHERSCGQTVLWAKTRMHLKQLL